MGKTNKKVRRCSVCGGVVKNPLRYRPEQLGGRFVLACRECVEEAQIGKYGDENRRYYRRY